MGNFLESYSPPKLNQEEIDHINKPVTRKEIAYVIKNKQTNKNKPSLKTKGQDQMASQVNSTKHTWRNWCPSSLNFFKRLKKKEHSQRHSMASPSHLF